MKKLLIIFFIFIISSTAYAKKNKNSWDYPLLAYKGWEIKGSENHYKFKSNLRQDKNILSDVDTLDGLRIKKSLRYNV